MKYFNSARGLASALYVHSDHMVDQTSSALSNKAFPTIHNQFSTLPTYIPWW